MSICLRTLWHGLIVVEVLSAGVREEQKNGKKLEKRVFNGSDAAENEFPSQVFLYTQIYESWKPASRVFFCGGTIISSRWILTAAHCVNSSYVTYVESGSSRRGPLWSTKRPKAKRVIVHEKFRYFGRNNNNAADDVALVELVEPLDLDGKKRTEATLPQQGKKPMLDKGVTIGWGITTYGDYEENVPEILQKLEVDVVSCPEMTPSVVCVGTAEGSGICSGDSGGPLFVNGTIVGIASYLDNSDKGVDPNANCGGKNTWAVYMQVSSYRQWIKEKSGV